MAETFLSSKAVQVYPCAYRGTDTDNNLYNPEAQLNTEFNLTNIKNIDGKKSWVIDWEGTSKKLKCVIGGYYFDLDLSTPLGTDGTLKDSTAIYAYIKVLPMGTVDDTNTKYPAYTLSDVSETGATTTGKILDDGGNFKGVKLANSNPTGDNIVVLHALSRNNTTEEWRVNSDAWLLNTNNIVDVGEDEPISYKFTTLHLVGAETGEIEELKVDKVQSYLESQIDIVSDVNVPTLGVDTITTRNEPQITVDKPFELRTSTNEGDVNFFRVVNENPDSTDEVYIDNSIVQVASQSQDLVSNLSKSGVTTLNKETTGQYQLTGSELTSHSLLLGYLDSTGTMDLHIISELSAEELRFTNNTEYASLDVQSINFIDGQESGALTSQNIQFQDAAKGVTTYRVDTITRKPLGAQEPFELQIPSKTGTIATLDDIYNDFSSVFTGTDGKVDLFTNNKPTKNYVMFTLIITFGDTRSVSLGRIHLKNNKSTYSFLCSTFYQTTTTSDYYSSEFMVLIDTSNWKLTLLSQSHPAGATTGAAYEPVGEGYKIDVSNYSEFTI